MWLVLGLWTPQFKTEDGKDAKVKYFQYVHGVPNCMTTQRRPIMDFRKSEEEWVLNFIYNNFTTSGYELVVFNRIAGNS